ncbi:hypothetical protein CHCC20348_2405 [Bacillus paralicheniformis]|nr:hypothetical protein CHCC20348_2405 [Bacillus paralicheniformis]
MANLIRRFVNSLEHTIVFSLLLKPVSEGVRSFGSEFF